MKPVDDIQPWRAAARGGAGMEAEAAALAASVEEPAPLSHQAVMRIRAGVRARAAGPHLRRGPRARRWSVAFAAVLLGASVTTAAGMTLVWRAVSRRTPAQPAEIQQRAHAPSPRNARPNGSARQVALSAAPSEPAPATPAPSPAPSVAPARVAPDQVAPAASPSAESADVAAGRAVGGRTSEPPPPERVDAPAPRPSPASGPGFRRGSPGAIARVEAPPSEPRLLGESVRLNREGDTAGALRALDRYAAIYPAGVLAAEARRVRLAALLRSGDHRAALALVEATLASIDPEPDMLLVRAELRAEAQRCAEALPDFDRALAGAFEDATAERAAFGRAVCLARVGQQARAREAFVAYRARFPRGRFSAEVARLLGESAGHQTP